MIEKKGNKNEKREKKTVWTNKKRKKDRLLATIDISIETLSHTMTAAFRVREYWKKLYRSFVSNRLSLSRDTQIHKRYSFTEPWFN